MLIDIHTCQSYYHVKDQGFRTTTFKLKVILEEGDAEESVLTARAQLMAQCFTAKASMTINKIDLSNKIDLLSCIPRYKAISLAICDIYSIKQISLTINNTFSECCLYCKVTGDEIHTCQSYFEHVRPEIVPPQTEDPQDTQDKDSEDDMDDEVNIN
jgi:hypothetical protein